MISDVRKIEHHFLDMSMTIRDFKSYVLAINKNMPFFLEFNMDNSKILGDLVEKSQNQVIKVFQKIDLFDGKFYD